MSFANIKKMKSEKGFTIVELLIVIVVIGILASIVIVAYNGVQGRAKSSKALTNARAVQDSAEAYNGDNGSYPLTLAALRANTNSVTVPSTVIIITNAGNPVAATPVTSLNTSNGDTNIQYDCMGPTTCTGTGGRIVYWDFGTSKPSINIFYLGVATSASTFLATP
ncbi:MAG: type II secretion system protein [Candidatus Saccharimonadales bacterium]